MSQVESIREAAQAHNGDAGPVKVDFDYTAPLTFDDANDEWRELRNTCPVGWSDRFGGHWIFAGYEDVTQVLKDWETFSSKRPASRPNDAPVLVAPTEISKGIPQELDPPEWRPVRRLVVEQLRIALDEERVLKWVDHYLDRKLATGAMDLTTDLASPATGAVVLDWLGWSPSEEWERISAAFHYATGFPPGSPEFAKVPGEMQWISQRITEQVQDRRDSPRADGITAFSTAEIDGEPMSTEYAEGTVMLTIAGGVETTVSAATAALVHLHFHRDDRAALLEDPSQIGPFLDEVLRFYPPLRTFGRVVRDDATAMGCPMHAGDKVLIGMSSANRDDRAFPDGDTFKRNRPEARRHVSFGSGIHRCPGEPLARVELKALIGRVLELIPDYQIDEEHLLPFPSAGFAGGWARVPITFTPVVR